MLKPKKLSYLKNNISVVLIGCFFLFNISCKCLCEAHDGDNLPKFQDSISESTHQNKQNKIHSVGLKNQIELDSVKAAKMKAKEEYLKNNSK